MIDEEEQTVRFVHHTARRFCLGALGGSLYGTLPFTEIEAHQELGETTVTYLNYGIFGRQLSTRVVPNIDVRKIPEQISHATIGSPRFARNLFKRTPAKPRDIGPILTRLDPNCTTGNRSQGQHPFYSYAQRFWLLQSRHMIKSNMRSLWDRLAHDPDALNIQVLTFTPHLVGLLDNIEAKDFTPEIVGVIWALNYSHVFLFDHLVGSKRDHKLTVRGLVRQITLFLKYFKAFSTQPAEFISVSMVSEMTLRLLPIAIELGAYDAVQRMIQWVSADSILLHSGEEDMRRPTCLPTSSREDSIRSAAQIVRSTWDMRMLRLLVKGRLSSFGDNTHMIEGFLKSQIPQEVLLRVCLLFTQAGVLLTSESLDTAYAICNHFTSSLELNSDLTSAALNGMLSKVHVESAPVVICSIFRRACYRGNSKLAYLSWPSKHNLKERSDIASPFQGDEIQLTLQTMSRQRSKIAHKLLSDEKFLQRLVHGPALDRAVDLKDWRLAKRLVDLGADPKQLIQRCTQNETLHYCVLAIDLNGLDFLLGIGMDVNQVSNGPNFLGYAPAELLARGSSWSRYHSFGELVTRGVEPRRYSRRDTYATTSDEQRQRLMERLEDKWCSTEELISLLLTEELSQTEVSDGTSWTGRVVCMVTTYIRKTVTACFSLHSDGHGQPSDVEQCLKRLRELDNYMHDTLEGTRRSPFNHCETLWSLHEIVGTVELLRQPQGKDGRQSPDPDRFRIQTMLLEIADHVLRDMTDGDIDSPGSSLNSTLDDFCSTLSQRQIAGIMPWSDPAFSSCSDFFRQTLRPAFEEHNLPWVFPCMIFLGQGYSVGMLKDVLMTLRGRKLISSFPLFDVAPSLLEGSSRALQFMGCSEREAQYLYERFGKHLP